VFWSGASGNGMKGIKHGFGNCARLRAPARDDCKIKFFYGRRRRWKRGFQTTFGASRKLSVCCLDFKAEQVQVESLGSMSAMKTRQHGYGFFLLVSIVGALITTFTLLAALYFSLRLDEDHRSRFFDPFLLAITFIWAAVLGVIASPLLFFCLRRKRLSVALPVVFVSVLTSAAVLTPFSDDYGFYGAGVALLISVLGCTMLPNIAPEPS
jgi:hypothetical protein